MEGNSTQMIRCIKKTDKEYPQKLLPYSSMPAALYVKGQLPSQERPSVAVIGARMCSPYGRIQAFRYAKFLSAAGVQIISGMALGIDSEGHKVMAFVSSSCSFTRISLVSPSFRYSTR